MTFKKWIPTSGIEGTFYLKGISDDYEGFRLLLKNKSSFSRILRISFDAQISYRNIDEGDLLKTLNENDFDGWTFYTVNDSEYLKWFFEESCNLHKDENIIHYAIYTPNDCLDILSSYAPDVEWLN